MSKITFSPRSADGGIEVSGELPSASGDLYLRADGGNTITGRLQPSVDSTISIGIDGQAFDEGIFTTAIYIDGISFINIVNEFSIRNFLNNGYRTIVAREFRTASSGGAMSGAMLKLISSGDIRWGSAASPALGGSNDINITRNTAGIIQLGISEQNANGSLEANSGIFTSGIVIIGQHSSGCVISVDNDGLLSVTGPFNYE